MKKTKITYWTSTALISVMMTFSAFSYLTNPMMKEAFAHLGFHDYFRFELAASKILGAILLLATVHIRLKEWIYAGFTITFISAFISHAASGDPLPNTLMPVLFMIPLAVSYFTYHQLQKTKRTALALEFN